MKYNIGDKVKIRRDLVINDDYGNDSYIREMDDIVKENDYVLTINAYECDNTEYTMVEDNGDYYWTDEMIEKKEEKEDMKYNIGDKVRIRKDLVVGERYEGLTYFSSMKKEAERGSFTIDEAWIDSYGRRLYEFEECAFTYSEEMIEGLAEPTDRQKFEGWMRKLSSLPYDNKVWHAFNYIVTAEPDRDDGYDDKLKIVSDFLFDKKMTKAEIEKELGYKIEIVEE